NGMDGQFVVRTSFSIVAENVPIQYLTRFKSLHALLGVMIPDAVELNSVDDNHVPLCIRADAEHSHESSTEHERPMRSQPGHNVFGRKVVGDLVAKGDFLNMQFCLSGLAVGGIP